MTCPVIKKNEGTLDRVIRVVVGLIAVVAGYFWLTETAQVVAYVVGFAALVTGIVGFCGLYSLLGISTLVSKKKSSD